MHVPHYYRNENIEEVREFIVHNGFGILVSTGQTGASAAHKSPTINGGAPRILATHIPMLLDKSEKGEDILSGHVSRANPHHKLFAPPSSSGKGAGGLGSSQVLAIFLGPHAYVSSSWYSHENVPTWNYIAVHVYGKINIIEGDRLLRQLKMLVDKYEGIKPHPASLPETERGENCRGESLDSPSGEPEGSPLRVSVPPSTTGKGAGGLGSISLDYVKKQMGGIVGFEIVIDEIQAAYKLSQNRNEQDYDSVIRELENRGDAHSLAVAAEMRKKKPKG